MKRMQTNKRSISTIPQSIERLAKATPGRRTIGGGANERQLWSAAPHATFPAMRPSVAKVRRTGLMATSLVTPSGRRCGFARVGSLVEMTLMSLLLPAFVLAIPLMLSACAPKFAEPKFAEIEQTISLPAAQPDLITAWCCQITCSSEVPVQ